MTSRLQDRRTWTDADRAAVIRAVEVVSRSVANSLGTSPQKILNRQKAGLTSEEKTARQIAVLVVKRAFPTLSWRVMARIFGGKSGYIPYVQKLFESGREKTGLPYLQKAADRARDAAAASLLPSPSADSPLGGLDNF